MGNQWDGQAWPPQPEIDLVLKREQSKALKSMADAIRMHNMGD